MAHKLVNRAKMTVSGTPGTGAVTLGSAVAGFDTFANAGVSNGDTVSYAIEDGANWEWGTGTYSSTGPTLTRTSVGRSSSGTSAISATSAAIVFLTALAGDLDGKAPLSHTHTASQISDSTSTGRSVLTAADAAAARTAIGAGTSSTTGTVTSVGISNGGGLSVSGSPVTTSGSITVSIAATSNGYGTRTVSASDPSGGSDGDIWLKV